MLLSGSLSSTDPTTIHSNTSLFAGATISATDPFPAVMLDYTRPPTAAAGMTGLIEAIFSDPKVNSALTAAISTASVAREGDSDRQKEGTKE